MGEDRVEEVVEGRYEVNHEVDRGNRVVVVGTPYRQADKVLTKGGKKE